MQLNLGNWPALLSHTGCVAFGFFLQHLWQEPQAKQTFKLPPGRFVLSLPFSPASRDDSKALKPGMAISILKKSSDKPCVLLHDKLKALNVDRGLVVSGKSSDLQQVVSLAFTKNKSAYHWSVLPTGEPCKSPAKISYGL